MRACACVVTRPVPCVCRVCRTPTNCDVLQTCVQHVCSAPVSVCVVCSVALCVCYDVQSVCVCVCVCMCVPCVCACLEVEPKEGEDLLSRCTDVSARLRMRLVFLVALSVCRVCRYLCFAGPSLWKRVHTVNRGIQCEHDGMIPLHVGLKLFDKIFRASSRNACHYKGLSSFSLLFSFASRIPPLPFLTFSLMQESPSRKLCLLSSHLSLSPFSPLVQIA